MKNIKISCVICAVFASLIFGISVTATAGTLLLVSGPNDETTMFTPMGSGEPLVALGFSTSAAYTNVSLSVALVNFQGYAFAPDLEVFLTTRLGPGTTEEDHEIAHATVSPTMNPIDPQFPYAISFVPLLSGLNLDAGEYFLMLHATGAGVVRWVSSPNDSASVTGAPGVLLTHGFIFNGGDQASYLPSSVFGFDPLPLSLWTFAGDGDPTPVPEHGSTLLYLSIGIVGLIGYSRRERK